MKRNIFLKQSLGNKSSVEQSIPHKSVFRSVGTVTVILLVLSVLVTACSKPEKEELIGTWRWTSTQGGIAGDTFTPESAGFDVTIVFKGGTFTLYKDGKKITTCSYQINYEDNRSIFGQSKGECHTVFPIQLNIAEWQHKKIAEATNHNIHFMMMSLADIIHYDDPSKNDVLKISDNCDDGYTCSFERE